MERKSYAFAVPKSGPQKLDFLPSPLNHALASRWATTSIRPAFKVGLLFLVGGKMIFWVPVLGT